MRTSLYLVGFAAASIMGAGAVGFGCSSSSSPAAPVDSGTTEASTEDGGGTDGGSEPDSEPAEAAPMCTAAPVNIATFDGGAVWSCTQAACEDGGLVECGGDCTCNAAVFSALLCVNDGGTATTCFTNALTPVYMGTIVPTFANCLQSKPVMACTGGTPPGDGGTDSGDAAPVTDSGSPTDAADGGG